MASLPIFFLWVADWPLEAAGGGHTGGGMHGVWFDGGRSYTQEETE